MSSDPERLRSWCRAAFVPAEADSGFLELGGVGLRIARRADCADTTTEPGPTVLNFHVEGSRSVAAHPNDLGASWLADLEERPPRPGTLVDPDGNHVQNIELGGGHATT